jgi:serine/threonine protein kinase
LEYVSYFNTVALDVYYVYSPLAVASLGTVLKSYKINLPAIFTHSMDFLDSLSFLHSKGIMHRDINLNNLAVTSFDHIKGVIINLDSATNHQASRDHYQGTIPYLAPEIISLKEGKPTISYDKSVDIWALGLSLFSLHTAQPFLWNYFSALNRPSHMVTAELHAEFHQKVTRSMQPQNTRTSVFLGLIKDMTAYAAGDRFLASQALQAARSLTGENCQGSIVLLSGQTLVIRAPR